jgi:hypothetical protein
MDQETGQELRVDFLLVVLLFEYWIQLIRRQK